MLERNNYVGGLATTFKHNGYKFDLGGHRWTFTQAIADLAPENWGGTSAPALTDGGGDHLSEPL